MPNITINSIDFCPGGNHVRLNVTIGTITVNLSMNKREFDIERTEDELRNILSILIRNTIKELNLTTGNQIRTALTGKVYKL